MTAVSDSPVPRYHALGELVETVVEEIGVPLDGLAVAATLESQGVRDVDAVERYGWPDVFGLAGAVYKHALATVDERPAASRADEPARRTRGGATISPPLEPRAALRAYLRGAFFFVPVALQMLSLVVIGASQWGYLNFSLSQASVVSVAVGASFVVTAGASQAIGFFGPLFEEPGKHALTERLTYRVLALALTLALAFGGVLAALAALAGLYPAHWIAIGLVYYALLAALWLAAAALYMLHAYVPLVAMTLSGIGMTTLLLRGLHTGIYAAHWVGLATSVAVAGGLAARRLRRGARATTGDRRIAKLPFAGVLWRRARPYIAYGTLYFAFLFADRLVAWTAGTHPLPVWFSVSYEVGVDWALVSVILGMAFLEVIVATIPKLSEQLQERTSALHLDAHNRAHRAYQVRSLAIVVGLLVLGSLISYLAADLLASVMHGDVRHLIHDHTVRSVYVWGLSGYALLVVGLANASFLFSVARPWLVAGALLPALTVDVAVGLVLSRTGHSWEAAIGLTSGALVFALLTTAAAWRAGGELDFAYYAAI